ncbi:MAG TPA: GNAT family N-acetyltransferase [Gaiellaceae bacterium]|nr:GNAT family N-acetyltransferase [Gaiellaceae bacterium]
MTLTVRVCSSSAELERSLEIYNEVLPRRAATSEDIAAWKASATATEEFLGSVDGVDAGSAAVSVGASLPDICRMFLTVLAELRCRGVGSALLDASAGWAVEHGVRELEATVESDDKESIGFALRRGFEERSREMGLELDVTAADLPAAGPPEGIEIVLFADRPELADGAYDVGSEALPDIPGHEDWTPPPLEQFVESHLRGLAVFLAVVDGEVVGYAKLREHPDGRTADHGMTAVKRAWRGRGIAKSLKLAEITWARANGIERLTASNEERNAPMLRINESLGYRPAPGRVYLRGPATAR